MDRDGNIDSSPAVRAFVVEPPWFKNPWVIALALSLLTLAGVQTGRVVKRGQRLQTANEELTVEAALERVRGQALAMQESEDILGVAQSVYSELRLRKSRAGVYHVTKDG